MSNTAGGPIFHVEPRGRLGSRMFQYMVALSFRALVPDCRISNVQMPEWGIDHPPIELEEPIAWAGEPQHIDLAGLAQRVRREELRSIVYTGRGQRLENFPSLDVCRPVFRPSVVSPTRFGERHIICHVRAPDADPALPDINAPLTPIAFYAGIVQQTGLIPVFVGPGAGGMHGEILRRHFPSAVFSEAGDAVLDFETMRQAQAMAVDVSSFAWLAAWLSHGERIFLAVNGRFNPMQEPSVDLLPFGDPRYCFHLFPVNYAMPPDRQSVMHDRIARLSRFIPQDHLQRLLRDAPRFDPSIDDMMEAFDAAWYLANNRDVAAQFGRENTEAARWHYRDSGMRERRLPFALSPAWYAERYPMAALEVSQGDYSGFAQHYVAVGRTRGYRAVPEGVDRETEPTDPSACGFGIEMLAEEVVVLEHAAPVEIDLEVSPGRSFQRLLSPENVADFDRVETTGDMRIFRLRNVVLDTSTMMLFSGHRPLRETLYLMNQGDFDYARVKPLHPEATNAATHYIVGGNVAAGNVGAGNYYHWMAQSLPAIDWGVRHRRHSDIAIAVPPLRRWQVESLALLGYAHLPRLTLRPVAHYALASAEYAEFLGARMPGSVSKAAAETFGRLRAAVEPAADGADTIYVARTDSTRRIMMNEDALIAMLERQGVHIVVPGVLPVRQQLAMFRRARLVIGPHGAGLSNLVACEPGTQVYELVPSFYANNCFNRLAQTCRLHWWGDAFQGGAGGGDPFKRTWRVDLDVVAGRLDEIRARMATRERAA
ncbi:MAG TPA: glycosyltransferase 61 family protein [Acetobacteraceae bacterium]|nr:glycosyltransferase 61 family protein [Acetobacteraceae bacterium]